ncbi:M6 family metalloprotease domain-containing protein [Candidatus Zixiibacteriota bacterium]
MRTIREVDPTAFEFRRAHFGVTEQARRVRESISQGTLTASSAEALGMSPAVSGTFNYPVLVGTFANSRNDTTGVTGDLAEFQQRLFSSDYAGGDPQHTGSLRQYYEEISYGAVQMTGQVYGYAHPDSNVDYYRNVVKDTETGIGSGFGEHMIDWIDAVIDSLDPLIDFSQYDTDGDGYVDILILAHNLRGFECGSGASSLKGFWSHRWWYEAASSRYRGQSQTKYTDDDDPLRTGQKIKISDYVMQPLQNCTGTDLQGIGVYAHELGHGFGLPDMYDTDGSISGESEGLGHWALMSSGNWNRQESPAHMSAWSRIDLGWITPMVITDSDALALDIPNINEHQFAVKVHTEQMAFNEYYLLENRQAIGFDTYLHSPGLLIYHINEANSNNRDPLHLRWALEQADGLFHLENNINRGDGSDAWPGLTGKDRFWEFSFPDSKTASGEDSYVDITLLTGSQDTMRIDLFATPAFLLNGPVADSVVADSTPLLDWDDYSAPVTWGTLSYAIELDTLDTFITAVRDTSAVSSFEWPQALIEDIPLFWRVIAFDNQGNSRPNSGGTASFTVDASAPDITIGVLRNPVLTDHVDLLLLASEVLWSYSLSANGTDLTLLPVSASTSFIQRADYQLISAGTIDLHAAGTDAAGNQATADVQLSAAAVAVGSDADISSADGRLQIHIPRGAVWSDGTALLLQSNEREPALLTKSGVLPAAGNDLPGSALSPVYWIDVPDLVPGRMSRVTIEWTAGAVGPGEMPALWTSLGGEWIPQSTAVDLSTRQASAAIERFGFLQLRTEGGELSEDPGDLTLESAYPNPFNPSTRIAFRLPRADHVRLVVMNTRGQTVQVLAEGTFPAGRHTVTWRGDDHNGHQVASGIYLYILETSSGRLSRKMTLLR